MDDLLGEAPEQLLHVDCAVVGINAQIASTWQRGRLLVVHISATAATSARSTHRWRSRTSSGKKPPVQS